MKVEPKQKVTHLQSEYSIQQEKMQQLMKRRKKGLVRRLAVFSVLVIVFFALMASKLISQASDINEKIEEKQRLEEKLANLKEEQKELEKEIMKLNDDEYIAKLARRDYFLSDEGEIIFNLDDGAE